MPTADLYVVASAGGSAAELSGSELLLVQGVCFGFLDCFLSSCKTSVSFLTYLGSMEILNS